jgi:hypothetical protein
MDLVVVKIFRMAEFSFIKMKAERYSRTSELNLPTTPTRLVSFIRVERSVASSKKVKLLRT